MRCFVRPSGSFVCNARWQKKGRKHVYIHIFIYKTNINAIAICKAMLILCTLSTYIVAVLCSFQKIWLQLDDNWLKSFAFYDSVTFESWQGAVQFGDSIFPLCEEINSYYWPWCKPTGNTFQTNHSGCQWFACGVSFTIFPDYLMIYALI